MTTEPTRIGKQVYDQTLIPGVAPISLTKRDLAAYKAAKDAKRNQNAKMPCGGLFDELTINQLNLF